MGKPVPKLLRLPQGFQTSDGGPLVENCCFNNRLMLSRQGEKQVVPSWSHHARQPKSAAQDLLSTHLCQPSSLWPSEKPAPHSLSELKVLLSLWVLLFMGGFSEKNKLKHRELKGRFFSEAVEADQNRMREWFVLCFIQRPSVKLSLNSYFQNTGDRMELLLSDFSVRHLACVFQSFGFGKQHPQN